MASQEGGSNISAEKINTDLDSNNNTAEVSITIEMGEEHLHKVSKTLQQLEPFLKFSEPRVVSLGPYHVNVEHLEITVADKRNIKYYLLQDREKKAEYFDDEMRIALKDARDLYVEDKNHNMSSEEFNDMMILDACFIIHIIDYMGYMKKRLRIKPHLLPLVVEDIFLLENQLPFAVLEAAMTSLGQNAERMTRNFFSVLNLSAEGPSEHRFFMSIASLLKMEGIMGFSRDKVRQSVENRDSFWKDGKKVHLLQILRADLLSYEEKKYEATSYLWDTTKSCFWHPTRCATELKANGITFHKRESRIFSLEGVEFEEGFIFGQLFLPSINLLTKRRLLNLIAYELSSEQCGYEITTYVSFLDGLIDRPEDVKELRSKNILPRGLGSDEEVAEFFNMVGTDLAPDPRVYYQVLQDIEAHCCNTWRVGIGHIRHKYFGSHSDTISFLIAAFLFLIALAQAYTSFFPIKK